MDNPDSSPTALSPRTSFAGRFNLHHDRASDEDIDRGIRAGVELHGATPWILMLAIVVASVGLNTNSTAVIIAARGSSAGPAWRSVRPARRPGTVPRTAGRSTG
ncbi:hypothetical protein E4L96_06075 [Massilia arenosa]|uniref:Uncharacterized protein n=1 Tax=Zemynaea arenosa TaxID=2561931 RepID=A0A4Y9SHL7_9BURK|nr:hypothetical protein [Massilia arenosa]TFW24496.1 hypothetical protein E4L96_06075 [Massilia arenosa]